jgi:hypothetical protein
MHSPGAGFSPIARPAQCENGAAFLAGGCREKIIFQYLGEYARKINRENASEFSTSWYGMAGGTVTREIAG